MEKETATKDYMKSLYWTPLKEGQTESDIEVKYTLGQAKSLAENSFKSGWDAAMAREEEKRQLILKGYEWWEYFISQKENQRLLKKYYPNEPNGYPRFFMDTDKARIYCLENGIEAPVYLLNSDLNDERSVATKDQSR